VLSWLYKAGRDNPDIEVKATCAPHYYRILHARANKEGRKLSPRTDGMAALTKGCLAGSAVCFVGRTGNVQPCGYLPIQAGNIRERPFREIWEKSGLFKSLREPVSLKGKCGACEYASVCMGCRARAYAQTGDYLEEEPYCIYVPPGYRK
jgi:radical SAM protein with 4Fe4S-binding SPASM domain